MAATPGEKEPFFDQGTVELPENSVKRLSCMSISLDDQNSRAEKM